MRGRGVETAPPPVERMAQDIARSGAQSVIVFVSDESEEYVATAGTDQPTGRRSAFAWGA